MRKAVVFGGTGGMGYALVMELVQRGFHVTALARTEKKLTDLFGHMDRVRLFTGDALQEKDVLEACSGAELIFHSINVPYPQWEEMHPVIMENLLRAAKAEEAVFILADNIYAYGRQTGLTAETAVKAPHTKKGKLRLRMEGMVKAADVPYLIIHFPDYYGPHAENTYIHYTLWQMLKEKRAMFVGSLDLKREYVYTPDGAKAAVELALTPKAFRQNWNIPGSGTMSGREFIEIVRGLTGYEKNVMPVGRRMISLIGLFDKMMRESVEMMYLTEEPVVLSGAKYEREIGPVPSTPYEAGIRTVIASMQKAGN